MPTTIFPPLPPYEGLHPIVVHFPIALLFIAPLFIVFAAFSKKLSRSMVLSALVLFALGTAFAFLATSTGSAAEDLAENVPGAKATLDKHEDLAELARNLFLGVTLLLAVLGSVYCKFYDKTSAAVRVIGAAAFLAACAAPALVLANAAHLGGQLVHVNGVRAPMGPAAGGTGAPAAGESVLKSHHDDD